MTALVHSSVTRFEQAIMQLAAAKRSPHTRAAYAHEAKRWIEFCTTNGVDPFHPALGHTTMFRDALAKLISKESVYRALAALSSLYNGLRAGGIAIANPFHPDVLAWPRQDTEGKTAMLSDDEINAMIKATSLDDSARGRRDLAILRLLYDTGLRRESIATLRRDDYQVPLLRATVKGGKKRQVPLVSETVAALDAWLAVAPTSAYVFPSHDRIAVVGHIGIRTINTIVHQRGLEAGVRNAHPHRFRAAFITAAYDAGIPERDIQAAAGHNDPKTTRRYDRGVRGLDVAAKIAEHRKRKGS